MSNLQKQSRETPKDEGCYDAQLHAVKTVARNTAQMR